MGRKAGGSSKTWGTFTDLFLHFSSSANLGTTSILSDSSSEKWADLCDFCCWLHAALRHVAFVQALQETEARKADIKPKKKKKHKEKTKKDKHKKSKKKRKRSESPHKVRCSYTNLL